MLHFDKYISEQLPKEACGQRLVLVCWEYVAEVFLSTVCDFSYGFSVLKASMKIPIKPSRLLIYLD